MILPDGKVLNYELINAGFAWWYREYAPENRTLERLEHVARSEKQGLWRDKNPVPPWEYRAGKKVEAPESGPSRQLDKKTDPAFLQKVTLKPPYSPSYKGAPTDKLSVQYAVMAIAKQAGLGYAFKESQANLGSKARAWVRPHIENEPLYFALGMILIPKAVMYRIEGGKIVLLPAAPDVPVYTHERAPQSQPPPTLPKTPKRRPRERGTSRDVPQYTPPQRPQEQQVTVYITRTGKKYHRGGCRYLRKSKTPVALQDARRRGLTPCSVCKPPQ